MPGLPTCLGGLCALLLSAGAAGVATHHYGGQPAGAATGAPGTATTTTTTAPAPTTTAPAPGISVPSVPAGSAPSTAALGAGMITPTDMGGYYRVDPPAAAAIVASAPCLAGLEPSGSQVGRAGTGLLGPDAHSVPTIVELAASYRGQEPATVYRDVVAAVDACPSFGLTYGGSRLAVPLQAMQIPPVGLADSAWSGTVPYSGVTLRVQVGVVLDGHTVLALMWIDTQPPSAAVMGNFTSTLSVALGKLA